MREAIAWLRSPEGEKWACKNINGSHLAAYQADAGPPFVTGMFSVITPEETDYLHECDDLLRGTLPGDEKLAPPEARDYYQGAFERLKREYPHANDAGVEVKARMELHALCGSVLA